MDFPIIFRFTPHRPSCVRIPARIAGIPMTVWKIPVTRPTSIPAIVATMRAVHTFAPPCIIIMQTAAPVHIVPSTDKSAISKIRKVMYTPIAIIPQISPCATAPGKATIKLLISMISSPSSAYSIAS